MKPYAKIGSLLLALIIAVAAVGCTPISLNAEWAYKTDKVELPIGVYSYSLKTAYSQAKNYASKLASYDEASDSWLDLEITDDDGDKAVAREWIKNEADKMCLNYIAVDNLVEELGIDMSGATADSAKKSAEEYWTVGPYASYGYYMPYKDEYEPYGVSFESFEYCTTLYNTKYSAIFDKIYGEGGSKEVKDDEFISYFTENYTDYKYIKANLYESTTDESNKSTDVALSDEDAKKITDEFDGDEKTYSKLNYNTYLFEGKTLLSDFCRILQIDDDEFSDVEGDSSSSNSSLISPTISSRMSSKVTIPQVPPNSSTTMAI